MIDKILIPIDFSETSIVAVRYASLIAQECKAELLLVNTYQTFHSNFRSKSENKKEEETIRLNAEKKMSQFMEIMQSNHYTSKISGFCINGQLISIIDQFASANNVDLVVMGTEGAKGAKYVLLGSNTYDITKKISLPILSVPDKIQNFKIKKVAFFTDYDRKDIETLKSIQAIFKDIVLEYHLVHIHDGSTGPNEQDFQKLKSWCVDLEKETSIKNITFELSHGKENILLIDDIAKSEDIDLLSLTMQEKTFWDKFLNKSFAREVILQSKTPIFLKHI